MPDARPRAAEFARRFQCRLCRFLSTNGELRREITKLRVARKLHSDYTAGVHERLAELSKQASASPGLTRSVARLGSARRSSA